MIFHQVLLSKKITFLSNLWNFHRAAHSPFSKTCSLGTSVAEVMLLDCCTVLSWWLWDSVWNETWLPIRIGWCFTLWLADPNIRGFLTCVALWVTCNALWGGIPTGFQRPLAVTLHSADGRPAVSAVQGDCERVSGLLQMLRLRSKDAAKMQYSCPRDKSLLVIPSYILGFLSTT